MGAKIRKDERDDQYKREIEKALGVAQGSESVENRKLARTLLARVKADLIFSARAQPKQVAAFLLKWVEEWILWHPGFGALKRAQAARRKRRNEQLLAACERFSEALEKHCLLAGLPKGGDDSMLEDPLGRAVLKASFSLGVLEGHLRKQVDPYSYGGHKYTPMPTLLQKSAFLSIETFGTAKWGLLAAMFNAFPNKNAPVPKTTATTLKMRYERMKIRSRKTTRTNVPFLQRGNVSVSKK